MEPPPLPAMMKGGFALVLVAVFEPRTPHHDTVVEQGAFTFFQRAHLLDHVGVLIDVELVDGGHLANLFLIAAIVGLRVVLIGEPQFWVRGPIGARSDIRAHRVVSVWKARTVRSHMTFM